MALARVLFSVALISWCAGWSGLNSAFAADTNPPPIPSDEQPEAMTRGPVHESFAEPIVTQEQEYVTSPSEPPANIEETPPDERPEGDNVSWVPGYWAWDADRKGHIWVSGCWRVAPPRMSWVSGYWTRTSGGWEWVPGFWTPEGDQEIEYLAAPPAIVDVMAPGEPTVADTIWVPPCYYWVDGRYSMRRGYWLGAQVGWVWTPSHYIRTPRGYIFIAGHWDYEIEDRGVLFAPVAFTAGYHVRAGYSYSPNIVININLLTTNMFVYPRYHHYYFGDYYDTTYISIGIFPRFDAGRGHGCYDPIYEHDRWRNRRNDSHWEANVRRDYDDRRKNSDLRPARTYREAEARIAKAPEAQRRSLEVAQPLARVAANKSSKMKFEHVNAEARAVITKQAKDSNTFREERSNWESKKSAPKSSDDRKGAIAPGDRRDDKPSAPAAAKDQQTPAGDRNDRGKNRVPDQDDKGDAPAPKEKPSPAENREKAAAPAQKNQDLKGNDAAARDDAPGQPDKVKVRSRPIADKPADAGSQGKRGNDKAPPARPTEDDRDDSKAAKQSERKDGPQGGDGRDSQKGDSQKGDSQKGDSQKGDSQKDDSQKGGKGRK